jgi:hypothetical protein
MSSAERRRASEVLDDLDARRTGVHPAGALDRAGDDDPLRELVDTAREHVAGPTRPR